MVSGISGSSGFDVDSTVSQLMKARRVPIDKLGQQKQILTWRRDTYKETNSKIVDFRNNKLFNFKLESTLKAKKVDLTGNTSAISAKANGNALTGTLTVLATTLATAASNMSNSDIRLNTTFDASLTLGSQAANIRNSFTQTVPGTYDKATISINGTQVVVDPNVDSLNNVIDRINKTTNVSAFFMIRLPERSPLLPNKPGWSMDQQVISLLSVSRTLPALLWPIRFLPSTEVLMKRRPLMPMSLSMA